MRPPETPQPDGSLLGSLLMLGLLRLLWGDWRETSMSEGLQAEDIWKTESCCLDTAHDIQTQPWNAEP